MAIPYLKGLYALKKFLNPFCFACTLGLLPCLCSVIYSPFLTSQKINHGKGFVKSDSNLAL